MQLIQLDLFLDLPPRSSSGKTCPESSTQKTTHSDVSWRELLDRTFRLRPVQRATNGRAQVWLPDQNAAQLGGCSTLNFSECPNDVEESTLSQVLERGGGIEPSQILFERRSLQGNPSQSSGERQVNSGRTQGGFGGNDRTVGALTTDLGRGMTTQSLMGGGIRHMQMKAYESHPQSGDVRELRGIAPTVTCKFAKGCADGVLIK